MADLDKDSLRGRQAKDVLDNPMFKQAVTTIREHLIAQLERSTTNDEKVREQIWLSLRLLKSLNGWLEEAVGTGKFADAELIQMDEARNLGNLYGWMNR